MVRYDATVHPSPVDDGRGTTLGVFAAGPLGYSDAAASYARTSTVPLFLLSLDGTALVRASLNRAAERILADVTLGSRHVAAETLSAPGETGGGPGATYARVVQVMVARAGQ